MTSRYLTLAALALASVACGPDPVTAGPPTSGGAGAGGSAGSMAGVGGGGMAGTPAGGSSGAGAGGTSGSGGVGGTAGMPNLEPTKLSETGLFADMATQALGEGVYAFEPQYKLWSDTAEKRRWVYLPPGAKIKTDSFLGPDYWEYPAGFKVWKEFARDNKVIETRLLLKKSAGVDDWYMIAYKWNEDGMDAVAVVNGEQNASGTMHDIPSQNDCKTCHASMQGRVLGFSALQLSHTIPGSLNLTTIGQMGWLSAPPAAPYTLPGTEVDKAALGYLHANCGMCHNNASNVYNTKASLDLWTHLDQIQTLQQTRAYLSTVCDEWPGPNGPLDKGDPIKACTAGHGTGAPIESELSTMEKRVLPMNPAMSGLHELMALRAGGVDNMKQMPPVGTEMVDAAGVAQVDAWINSLPAQ